MLWEKEESKSRYVDFQCVKIKIGILGLVEVVDEFVVLVVVGVGFYFFVAILGVDFEDIE